MAKAVRIDRDEDQEVGCLIWCGARSRGGGRSGPHYGSFSVRPRLVVRAHVAAAFLGRVVSEFRTPPGYHLAHTCQRSLCVEPRHLELQVGRDNILDSFVRPGRGFTSSQEDQIRYRGLQPCSEVDAGPVKENDE